MKKIISFLRKTIMYSKNMKEEIIAHEDKMFDLYSKIIHETYDEFFKNYGAKIVVERGWRNDILNSISNHFSYKRIPMIWGYSGWIECSIYKNDQLYTVCFPKDEDAECLFRLWNVSRVRVPWKKTAYILEADIDAIYIEMKRLMELVIKEKECIGGYIKKYLDNWNPLEISSIDDEYEKISEKIVHEYYEDDELGNVIYEKCCSTYGIESFTKSIEDCEKVAKEILNDYQAKWQH